MDGMDLEKKVNEAARNVLRAVDSGLPNESILMTKCWEKFYASAEELFQNRNQDVLANQNKVPCNVPPTAASSKIENIGMWNEYLSAEIASVLEDHTGTNMASSSDVDEFQSRSSGPSWTAVGNKISQHQPNVKANHGPGNDSNPPRLEGPPSSVRNQPPNHLKSLCANTLRANPLNSTKLENQNWGERSRPQNGEGPAQFTSARSRFIASSIGDEDGTDTTIGGPKPFKPPTRLGDAPSKQPSGPNRQLPGKGPQSTAGFRKQPVQNANAAFAKASEMEDENVHPRLKGIDPELVERIENEILESGQPVTFDDIAGLTFAKQCIEEMVVWPVRNPEFYTGLRQLPKGLLLFGPPGTGKTVLGKAIAHECKATFFSISASSLTSKWIGEGEKMVRALFAVAAVRQPSVVFIDEIDSLLTQRSSDENEASRRLKTEFLVQFDGAATGQDDVVLIIGATNRPQELDEAARRRFVRRLYVPLPDIQTRIQLLTHLLKKNDNVLTDVELQDVARLTEGYSGADVTNLAREASMVPLREILRGGGNKSNLRPIMRKDFDVALKSVKASVSNMDLAMYVKWNEEFGTQQYQGE